MEGSHVVALSLAAALGLFSVFFASHVALRRLQVTRLSTALVAPLLAGLTWFAVVHTGRRRGATVTDEAMFHHLYVLATVGLPSVGAVLAVDAWRRPAATASGRIASWLVAVAFALPAAAGVWATHVEPEWLRTDHVEVPVTTATLAAPIRIGVIADIQTDGFGDYEDRAIARLLAEKPDLILVAGDMTQVEWTTFLEIRAGAVKSLSALDAPYGVYVIQGNTDPLGDSVAELAADAGLTPLVDEVAEIEVRGSALRIGGLGWPNNERTEAARFVRDFDAGGGSATIDILLAHSPDAMLNIDRATGIDLVVSGHTHGGQISLPLMGMVWNVTELADEVAAGGLHELSGTQVYVSTGVGVQRGESPKVRFGVRPSVGILTLGS